MKWSSRGACAALSSCILLSCALCATAVGLKCFSLGSELREEPFRLDANAGAFYSGLLVLAGLSLLGSALLCCREKPLGQGNGQQDEETEKCHDSSQNFLLLGMLVFMLGVLSAFAGAVIDGDTVSLVERKYSHFCLQHSPPLAAGTGAAESTDRAKCVKLKDYQRGLVLSTIFNSLECLLGLLNLLLVKNYKSAQQSRRLGRRGRSAPLGNRHSTGSTFSVENEDLTLCDTNARRRFQAVSYIGRGDRCVFDEAGVEVHCGGHPSVDLPGYSPMDPELNPSYPFSYSLSVEMPSDYAELYPRENWRRVRDY